MKQGDRNSVSQRTIMNKDFRRLTKGYGFFGENTGILKEIKEANIPDF